MLSSVKFGLTHKEEKGLVPCLDLKIVPSHDDLRNQAANMFVHSLGYSHSILTFTTIPYAPSLDESSGTKYYQISSYRPEKQFALLDVSSIMKSYGDSTIGSSQSTYDEFRDKLIGLCQEYNVKIDTNITDGLDIRHMETHKEISQNK